MNFLVMRRDEKERERQTDPGVCGKQRGGGTWQLFAAEQEALIVEASGLTSLVTFHRRRQCSHTGEKHRRERNRSREKKVQTATAA